MSVIRNAGGRSLSNRNEEVPTCLDLEIYAVLDVILKNGNDSCGPFRIVVAAT